MSHFACESTATLEVTGLKDQKAIVDFDAKCMNREDEQIQVGCAVLLIENVSFRESA